MKTTDLFIKIAGTAGSVPESLERLRNAAQVACRNVRRYTARFNEIHGYYKAKPGRGGRRKRRARRRH